MSRIMLKIFYICFFLFLFWIFINGIGSGGYNSVLLIILEVLLILIGIWLSRNLVVFFEHKPLIIKFLLIAIIISMQISFAIMFRTDNTWGWDFDEVVYLAKGYVNGQNISFSYLAAYSTNILYFWLVVTIFRISKFAFGECYTIILLICNVLALDISIMEIYYVARSWKSKTFAQTVCFMCLFFVPFWLYLPIAYQDIFSIPLYILPVLLYTLSDSVK